MKNRWIKVLASALMFCFAINLSAATCTCPDGDMVITTEPDGSWTMTCTSGQLQCTYAAAPQMPQEPELFWVFNL